MTLLGRTIVPALLALLSVALSAWMFAPLFPLVDPSLGIARFSYTQSVIAVFVALIPLGIFMATPRKKDGPSTNRFLRPAAVTALALLGLSLPALTATIVTMEHQGDIVTHELLLQATVIYPASARGREPRDCDRAIAAADMFRPATAAGARFSVYLLLELFLPEGQPGDTGHSPSCLTKQQLDERIAALSAIRANHIARSDRLPALLAPVFYWSSRRSGLVRQSDTCLIDNAHSGRAVAEQICREEWLARWKEDKEKA